MGWMELSEIVESISRRFGSSSDDQGHLTGLEGNSCVLEKFYLLCKPIRFSIYQSSLFWLWIPVGEGKRRVVFSPHVECVQFLYSTCFIQCCMILYYHKTFIIYYDHGIGRDTKISIVRVGHITCDLLFVSFNCVHDHCVLYVCTHHYNSVLIQVRSRLAMAPFAPLGKNPPGLASFPVPYTVLRISRGVREYETEYESADRMLLVVRFSAPSRVGTMMPSSLLPHIPSRFLSLEILAVNSATVMPYGSTFCVARS